jgi:hypothetical protein
LRPEDHLFGREPFEIGQEHMARFINYSDIPAKKQDSTMDRLNLIKNSDTKHELFLELSSLPLIEMNIVISHHSNVEIDPYP